MSSLSFRFTDNSERFLQELQRKKRKFGEQSGLFLESQAKKNITEFQHNGKTGYIDTGRARNSITHTYTVSDDNFSIYIGSNVEYFVWLEIGSGIYASDGKGRKTPWLYTDDKGEKHWTKGLLPSHSLQRAITDSVGTLQTMWIDILKE